MNPSEDNFVSALENNLIPVKKDNLNETANSTHNINERMEQLHIAGISIVVVRNFSIAHHQWYGKADLTTKNDIDNKSIFHACSISKFISSLGILRLVERKILNLDTPINNYLTSWKFPDNEYTKQSPVTIRHLLCHQAGIIDPESSFEIYDPKTPYPSNIDLISGNTTYHEGEVQASHIPGTQFNYSDGGFCILEQIILDVVGKSFEKFIQDEILTPLQIQDAFYHSPTLEEYNSNAIMGHDNEGIKIEGNQPIYPYMAAAGLWISPLSLAKIVVDFFLSLQGKGKLLTNVHFAKEIISSQGCFAHVGLGVFLDGDCPEPMLISNGWGVGFQANIIAFPQSGSASIIMMNTEPGMTQRESIIGEIYRGIGRIIEWPGF